jgi:hypothetical protein
MLDEEVVVIRETHERYNQIGIIVGTKGYTPNRSNLTYNSYLIKFSDDSQEWMLNSEFQRTGNMKKVG